MKIFGIQTLFAQNTYSYGKNVGEACSYLKNGQLNRDVISFGSKKTKQKYIVAKPSITINTLKHISGLPCIYCGKPMLSLNEYNNLINLTAEAKGEDLIKVLNSNREYIRRFKNNIADDIVAYANLYQNDDLQQLLIRIAPSYLATLESEQLAILNNIQRRYSDSFQSDEEKKIFNLVMQETAEWITNENGGPPFKCKQFYAELEAIFQLPIFRNRKAVKNILKAAKKMPQSSESENAFVVKYSRRTPKEIASQLYRDPLVTMEHIKPQSVGGKTIISNLVVACANCNNVKRSNAPVDVFVRKYPKTEEYIKNHFDALLRIGSLSSYRLLNINGCNKKSLIEDYVSDVAKTYMTESNDTLDLKKYVKSKH